MKPASFSYLRPDSANDACRALARYGDEARIIAGGQSLCAMLNMRLVTPSVLIDVNRLEALATIEDAGEIIVTGALVRQADALADSRIRSRVPLLAMALPHVGHYQTRNRGTLGGSVAHADPSAEVPLVLATLGGEVELRSSRRMRRLCAVDFFRSALVTAREPDEMLTALRWPAANARIHYAFEEFSVRGGDYAIVAVACMVEQRDDDRLVRVRLGFGGCGDMPQVIEPADATGRTLDDELVSDIARYAAGKLECRADLQATADYRRHLAFVLGRQVLAAAKVVAGARS
jgi:2-furoyl-CoA dehydrogenase FAD binding subunit